ncbi:MAG: PQQ-dependent sugar dehydrogenase [Saprospiraceae bacterium]|nr:PQQ-dependent sugar dehydrogenase [Saprospiraceae bacterium]
MKQLLTALLLIANTIIYAQLPSEFYDQVLYDNFSDIMGITFDEEGRLFLWEKDGKVWLVEEEGNLPTTPLLDLSDEVSNWKDHGLLGFSLDPKFLENGRFYLLYSVDMHHLQYAGTPEYIPDSLDTQNPTFGRVTRYQADPATNFTSLVSDSRKVLLGEAIGTGIPLYYQYHGLGSLLASQDGTLLISVGDGATNTPDTGGDGTGTFASKAIEQGILTPDQDLGSFKAQYLGSMQGKILRIDAETGDGLPTNPFFDASAPRSAKSRIWAYGLRNPYRIALRPGTEGHSPDEGKPGVIMVGDVGNGAWEEINIVSEGGMNFGWPLTEGYGLAWAFWTMEIPGNPMAPNPLYGNGGCNEALIPFNELMVRPYKNQDWVAVNPCDPTQPISEELHPSVESLPLIAWSNARWNPPARAVLPDTLEGNIAEIELSADNSPVEGENFNGFSSLAGVFYKGEAYPEKYRGKFFGFDFSGWIKTFDIDDNHQLHKVEAFHNESKDIIHLALNPADENLYYVNIHNEIRKITYGGNPPPVAVIETDKIFGPSPLTVQFDASNSYDSNLPLVAYFWEFGDGTTSTELKPAHIFESNDGQPRSYEVRLTVEDAEGAVHSTTQVISLDNTPPEADITSFEDGDFYPLHTSTLLQLRADVRDTETPAEELLHEWRVFFHHNDHYHPEPVNFEPQSHVLIDPYGCEQELYWYRIELKVTDPQGLSTTKTQEVFPYCGPDFVEWIDLEAIANDETVDLNWETQLEDSIGVFELQRSSDFYHFETIAELSPNADHVYTYVDEQPLRGTNIYRIKAITEDRAYTYSQIVTTVFPQFGNVRLYPNPVDKLLQIEIKEPEATTATLELFNPAGIPVFNTQWEITLGELNKKSLVTGLIPNGVYFYRVKNGSIEKTGKIMVRHY